MPGQIAITREVSSGFAACELTHLPRLPIDLELARAQHRAYEDALAAAGYAIERLTAPPDLPDAVFVEDVAVVLDELALVMRPGAASRRGEVEAVAGALARYRSLEFIDAPGTADGGDVLVAGRVVFVGRSTRTNAEAIAQIRALLTPHGYRVYEVAFRGCLHLKSAATSVAEQLLLINPEWVDADAFPGLAAVEVHPGEPPAANALRLADRVIFPSAFPQTAARLRAEGLRIHLVDASELAKAEGAVTCCSLIIPDRSQGSFRSTRGSDG